MTIRHSRVLMNSKELEQVSHAQTWLKCCCSFSLVKFIQNCSKLKQASNTTKINRSINCSKLNDIRLEFAWQTVKYISMPRWDALFLELHYLYISHQTNKRNRACHCEQSYCWGSSVTSVCMSKIIPTHIIYLINYKKNRSSPSTSKWHHKNKYWLSPVKETWEFHAVFLQEINLHKWWKQKHTS
jgi:hypothetical protein